MLVFRRISIAYSVIAAWVFGWLAGTFGLLSSIFPVCILFIPSAIAFRILSSDHAATKREYGYFGVTVTLTIVATALFITHYFDTGMYRLAQFEREYRMFHSEVSSMPEYNQVELSYTRRKGGCVYLHGHVSSKAQHEHLLEKLERIVHNNDAGFLDDVKYPGKPD